MDQMSSTRDEDLTVKKKKTSGIRHKRKTPSPKKV